MNLLSTSFALLAFTTMSLAGIIGHGGGQEELGETEYQHEVEHKHATSHQSFNLHHFHPVPVYIKKDEHPIELKGVKSVLKLVHPEAQHHSGHGLTIESHVSESHPEGGHGLELGHQEYQGHQELSHDFGGHGEQEGYGEHGHY